MVLVLRRQKESAGRSIVAAALGFCIAAGCATPPPPNTPELSRIFELRDRREGGDGYLVQMLAFPDAGVRRRAAFALGAVGGTDGTEPLIRTATEDPEPRVRRAAAFALGQLPGPDRGTTLARLMLDDNRHVRAVAVTSVRREDVGCWQELMDLLRDEDAAVRGQAALALLRVCGGQGRGANEKLSPQRRQMTATLLKSSLNGEADPEAHWRIVYALAHLAPGKGDRADTSSTALVALAANKRFGRWSRLFATRGLLHQRPSARIRATLLNLLKNRDWALIYEAMNVAAAPDPDVVPETGKDPPPRYHDTRVATELILLRSHKHRLIRERATLLLGRYVNLREVVVAVLRGDKKAVPGMRAAAVRALAQLLRNGAVPDIDHAIGDPSFRVRVGAARALAVLPDTTAVPRLRQLLQDTDSRVRTAALEILAGFRHSDRALALALETATVRELALRETIANTLAGIGDPKAVAALIAAYEDSPGLTFAEARRLMVAAVGKLGNQSEDTLAFLRTAARDEHAAVRREAARQLRARTLAVPDTKDLDAAEKAKWHTPRLGTDIPWSLLDQRPRLFCQTEQGSFIIELYPKHAPIHCHNLITLVENGQYEGRLLHRVVPNFVVQGGDARGDGFGANPIFGGQLRDEINPLLFEAGVVGMPKNADPDTGGDQIFIATVPTPHLDRRYTAFGRVVRGMEVVERIEVGDRLLGISRMSD
ncbi:MAG: HEAT repeat domain-containing protein [Planctomycetota bacterium]